MDWVFEVRVKALLSPSQQPFFFPQPPPPPTVQSGVLDQDNKISPSILLIIIILAIIFFISGLLHLLVRFLLRPPTRDPVDSEHATALQGQLQQLFHLHDAGVDQSFIDTLPVFVYKAIIGVKNPFDCAVCLCEFEAEDKLRLLPKCSHAFHMECIDTWLLSHSTCPLCRGSLLPDLSSSNICSPIVFVLESGSESSREIVSDREAAVQGFNTGSVTSAHLGSNGEDDSDVSQKSCEIPVKEDPPAPPVVSEERVVPVKLGKFINVDGGGGGEGSSSNSNVDARRCFSMGSLEYFMDEGTSLQVPIRPPTKKYSTRKPSLQLMPGHRTAMSECGGHSCREGFKGFDPVKGRSDFQGESSIGIGTAVERTKKESFSVSKIWLRSKEDKPATTGDSSRRAFSFRFPLNRNSSDDLKAKQNNSSTRTISEIDVGRWESGGGSELGLDEEIGSCISMDSQAKTPSFARRTLLWLVGRQNKVVHSSSSQNF
ncbi:RING-H2 finger protein ATL13-like [Telopea speciosissima]|uniref:RING-H2 finger protein ATL13-like n=1 Tax=Telopea speciosissima TaxID=54955 RepID=UPI001CC43CFF|nr:RING-H2 finger protein ATL13-like [Telopea speciosissima]